MSASPRTAPRSQKSASAVLAAASLLLFLAPSARAATLEQVYQRALEDPEFRGADQELNAAYSRGMRTLPKEERDKLRQSERFWIRENQDLLLQNPQREVEVLKQRFLKRRDELLQLKADSAPSDSPSVAAAPAPPTTPEGGTPRVWNEKLAANLERVYQSALQDPAFETADSALRAIFKEALSALNVSEREKLKPAQKAWVRENAVLIAGDPAKAQSILNERVRQRRGELLRILEQRRFEPAAPVPQPAPVPIPVAPPPSLPEPVFKEPPAPLSPVSAPPAPVTLPPTPVHPSLSAEPLEPVLPAPGNNVGAGLIQLFWALLGTWILGLGFFHYRAFTQKQKSPAANPTPALDIKGLYLATGTGFLVSLTPLLAAPSSLTAIVAVLFTIVGLGTAKIAAEEWARIPSSAPRKPPETPRQRPALKESALQEPVVPASVVPASTEAAPVHAELQRPRQGGNRRGNRQKRRGK